MTKGSLSCRAKKLMTLPANYSHRGIIAKFTGHSRYISENYIWSDGEKLYYSDICVLNGSVWEEVVWEGLADFDSQYIWTDGTNIYYSNGDEQYKLNPTTKVWETMTWTHPKSLYGNDIWTDGTNIYDGYDYVLNDTTWSDAGFSGISGSPMVVFQSRDVWTDGTNVFFTDGTYANYYVLNGKVWTKTTLEGFDLDRFYGFNVWTDGNELYYSSGTSHFKLVNGVWEKHDFGNHPSLDGKMWTDGKNIFFGEEFILLPTKVEKTYVRTNDTWKGVETNTDGDSSGGGITPTGTINITKNGTHDVTDYAEAVVNVPNPSTGTLEITEHGTYDVTNYASVEVYGTYELKPLTVTKNGVYENLDVDGYDKVTVNIADNPLPIEISTEAEMTALLETAEVGSVYKFTGETTDTYEKGSLYIVKNDTISFTVDGTEYRAESGMTWAEWVLDTNYNTIGSEAVSFGVLTYISSGAGDSKYISYNNAFVTDDEEIVANRAYVLKTYQASND